MNPLETLSINSWHAKISLEEQQRAIQALESGQVVYLPQLKFSLKGDENKFLSPEIADEKSKNIRLDLRNEKLGGANCAAADLPELKNMLARFAMQTKQLVIAMFPRYVLNLEMARTSFRPVEVLGRASSYRKDDTRLHVDAFPSTPNQGRRILRVFSNVNPLGKPRVWRVGEPFAVVTKRFFPQLPKPFPGAAKIMQGLRLTRGYRTDYDHYMLNMHNQMKADLAYQKNAEQSEIHFPPNSTWMVYTDVVSHAAMGGQYLFEQTFHLPATAMQNPELSPLRILEKVAGRALV